MSNLNFIYLCKKIIRAHTCIPDRYIYINATIKKISKRNLCTIRLIQANFHLANQRFPFEIQLWNRSDLKMNFILMKHSDSCSYRWAARSKQMHRESQLQKNRALYTDGRKLSKKTFAMLDWQQRQEKTHTFDRW